MLKSQLAAVPDDTLFPLVNILIRYVCPGVSAVDGVILSVVAPVALTQVFEFAFSVAATQEDVLNICNRPTFLMFAPMLLSLILGKLLVATNEYHTSGDAALPQKAFMAVVEVAEAAFLSVPEVFVHTIPGVKAVALPQASFPGWAIAAEKKHSISINSKALLT